MQKIGTIIEACERFGVPTEHIPADVRDVPVYRNGRLRTSLGRAVTGHPRYGRHIQIHKCVFADPQQMRSTLAHEVAHIIAGIRSGHNATWRRIARALGHSGKRLADAGTGERIGMPKRRTRPLRIIAVCDRCDVTIERRQRLPRSTEYLHAACGGKIRAV